jgi:Transposase IS200 like
MVVLEIVPDHVHLFARAHPSHSPARITNQFGSFISRWLCVRFLHLRSRLTTRRFWFYSAATGAVFLHMGTRRRVAVNGLVAVAQRVLAEAARGPPDA